VRLLWRCEAAWGAAGPFYRRGKAVRPGISRAREASTMAVEVGNISPSTYWRGPGRFSAVGRDLSGRRRAGLGSGDAERSVMEVTDRAGE
jgi:hypothetical protein